VIGLNVPLGCLFLHLFVGASHHGDEKVEEHHCDKHGERKKEHDANTALQQPLLLRHRRSSKSETAQLPWQQPTTTERSGLRRRGTTKRATRMRMCLGHGRLERTH